MPGEVCGAFMPQLGRRPAAHCARRRGHKGRQGSQTGGHWSAWYMENRRMRLLEYRDRLRQPAAISPATRSFERAWLATTGVAPPTGMSWSAWTSTTATRTIGKNTGRARLRDANSSATFPSSRPRPDTHPHPRLMVTKW